MKVIDIKHEWTWIFTEGLGKAYGCHINNHSYEVNTLKSSNPFFYFCKNIKYDEKTGAFSSSSQNNEVYKNNFLPKVWWGNDWTPPPLKEHYSEISPIESKKPILIVNNKYSPEWGGRFYNYLSCDFLDKFFSAFENEFDIYYIRYEGGCWSNSGHGYYDDVPSDLDFGDYKLINQKYPKITTIFDVIDKYGWGFNEAQCMIMSKSNHHISVAGGNAVLSSYFGGDVFIYNHHNCPSTHRGIWHNDSWLKELSGSNIIGTQNYDKLLEMCKKKWL